MRKLSRRHSRGLLTRQDSFADEHEWMLAVPEEPWKSLYCDELPPWDFKLPANSHMDFWGDGPIIEPSFEPRWLDDR